MDDSMFVHQVGNYHNVLHLVLRSIPRMPVKADEEKESSSCNNLFSPRITTTSKPKLLAGGSCYRHSANVSLICTSSFLVELDI